MDYSRYLPWSPRGLSWRSTNLNDFTYVDAGRFSEVTAFGYNEFSDTEKAVGGLNDDDMDYWRNAAEALRAEALEFSSPVQDVMRDVVMQARQWSGDVGLELPLGAEEGDIFSEYGDIWKKAGVSPPQTVGEVQNYLVRSMYPSFFEFAGKKAGYGGGFFEAFSDVSSSYIEGLGKWEPTTQPEVIRGARTSYYGAQELQRAYEQTGAPKGSFGYDDAINYRTMLGGVSENMYARGGYVSPEYDAMQAVDRYVRNRSLPAKGQWHGSGKNRYFEPTHDLYGQGQTATYEYDGETRQRLPYQLGNKSYKDVIYGQSYKPSPRAVSAQNVVTAMYTAGSFTEMAKQLPQQFLRNPTQMSHQYMGGDANIFGYGTMWGGWEESHQSREYELTHPRASRAFSVDVPAMPVVGQGGFKPGGVGGIETLSYSLPNSYYDLASEARGGRRNFLGLYQAGPEAGLGVSYTHANPPLLESPYHKPYYDVLKDISTGMGEKGMNWEYQQAIVRSQTEAGRIPGDIIGTTRGKRFDQGYDIGTQAGYASKGRAPTFTDLYPNSSVGSPQYLSAGGAVKERWSPKEYNFGLSNRKLEDAYYRERVMQGKHQLPPNVGFAYGTTSQGEYIDTSFTETFGHQGGPSAGGFQRIIPQDPTMNMPATQGQTPLLGSGRSGLLLPPPGSDDFVRQMPARQAGAGMPFAMGRGTSATHADSWYAGDQMYNEPMVSDRAQLEMAQRDVVQQTSLQGNPIMTMPLLPPGGRGRSEEIIPGENQYYEDRGASQHPSATPISRGTPLLPASTGNRESQFYGSSSAPFPSEYARDRMGPIELGARAGALGGREQLSSSTAIVPISGRFTRSENLGVPDMSDTLYGDDPGSSSTAQRHYQSPGVQGVLDSLRAGRSAMGSLRPGYGKTEAIVGAAHIGGPNAPGGGVSLSMSPLTSLNQQTTAALNKRGIRAFNLIGHPGEGEDDTAWAKVNKEFRDAVTESIDPKTGEWIKGKSPVVGVMSFEKYGALDRSRGLGKALVGLHDRGLMGPTTVDEAQEIGRGGRLMIKKIADVAKGMFPGSPTSLLGGTINRSQESMLQNLFGIGDEDIQRAPASMKHLDVSLEAVKQSDYEATGGRFAREARGGQLQYGYSTKLVDKLQIASQQEGREAFRYHKGFGSSGELMTPEELGKVEKLVEGGLTKNQTIAASPALGLGMNIKGTESVTQIGAARPSDIIQRALRIRPERLPSGEQDLTKNVGEFRMAVDPKQYEDFAKRAITNTKAMTENQLARAFQATTAEPWSKNWREASQQIDERLGGALEQQTGLRGMKYAGGEASRILQEAGLLKLEPTQGPRGESYQNWVAKGTNLNPNELARAIGGASYTSEFDPSRKNLSFRDFRSEQADVASRELRAMGSIVEQTKGMSPGGAGKVLTKGLNTWLSAGGKDKPTRYDSLNSLEDYAELEVPKQLSDKYVAAVEGATKVMEEQMASGTSMSDAMKGYSQTVEKAAGQMSGSPAAGVMSAQRLDEMGMFGGGGGGGGGGGTVTGGPGGPQSPRQAAFGMAAQRAWQGAQAPPPSVPPTSRMGLKNMGAMGGALYGAYLGSRFWRMFAEPSMQAMQEYGAMEAEMQPLMGDFGGELTGAAAQQGKADQVKMNLGRGAWELLEPLTGGMYNATQKPGVSRAITGIGVGAGLAAGGTIASMTLGGSAAMMKMANIGGSAMLGKIGALAAPFGMYAGLAALSYYGIREGQIQNQERMDYYQDTGGYNDPGMTTGLNERQRENLDQLTGRGGDPSKAYNFRAITGTPEFKEWRTNRDATSLATQIAKDAGFVGSLAEITPLIASMQNSSGIEMKVGNDLYNQAVEAVGQAASEGTDVSTLYAGGATYAAKYGAIPGTSEFNKLAEDYTTATIPGRFARDKEASVTEQYASQLAPWIGSTKSRELVRKFDLRDQASVTKASGLLGAYTTRFGQPMERMGRTAQGYSVSDTASAEELVALSQGMTAQGQAFVQGLTGQLADAGVVRTGGEYLATATGIRDATAHFTGSQFQLGGAIAGGDMQAQSFAAWNDPMVLEAMGLSTGASSKMYGQTGMPNYMTSGRDFMLWGQSLIGSGLKGAEAFNKLAGTRISEAGAQDYLGVSSPELASVWYNEGQEGAAHMLKMEGFANQRASVGNAMAKITAQERFLWGGGAWTGTPAEGSMWYLQDKMTALQHSSQMAEFAYSTDRMETTNEFAIRSEAIQGQRMQAGHAMQRWQTGFRAESMSLAREWGREDRGFQAEGMALQRQWGREDWQYQDQSRALSWEWGMEDMDEAIRMSSGRERKQLIKQRDRMGITHGREEEQIDKVRERQEEMWGREEEMFDKRSERQETTWAREEEQFEKQTEYSELLMGLDQAQYDLNIESRETLYEMDKSNLERRIDDYEKQHKLQEEITKLQRDHQAEQLELSKAALGLQAQAIQNAEDQYLLAKAVEPVFDKIEDEMALIAKYGKVANIFYSFRTMAEAMNDVNVGNINRVTKFLNALK